MTDQPTDLPWWNRVGLHSWTHPVTMAAAVQCLQHPDTGDRYVLRANAHPDFLLLWDDGLGAETIPCPLDHVPVKTDRRGFVVDRDLADLTGPLLGTIHGTPIHLLDQRPGRIHREGTPDQPVTVVTADEIAAATGTDLHLARAYVRHRNDHAAAPVSTRQRERTWSQVRADERRQRRARLYLAAGIACLILAAIHYLVTGPLS